MVPWAHTSPRAERRLDRFNRFYRANRCGTQTTERAPSVAVGRVCAMHAMWQINNSSRDRAVRWQCMLICPERRPISGQYSLGGAGSADSHRLVRRAGDSSSVLRPLHRSLRQRDALQTGLFNSLTYFYLNNGHLLPHTSSPAPIANPYLTINPNSSA